MENNKRYHTLFIIFLALSILMNAFLIVEGLLSGSMSSSQSGWLANIIANIFNIEVTEELNHLVRKLIGHYLFNVLNGLFTSLAINYYLRMKDIYKIKTFGLTNLLLGFVLAAVIELMQLLSETRLFAFSDVLINYSGYITGALIVLIIYYFIDKKRVAQKSDSDKLD